MRSVLATAALVALACSTSGGSSGGASVRVDGYVTLEFSEQPVCGDAGVSVLGRCAHETFTGSVEGDGDLAVTSITPVEPDGVVAITEDEVIHLEGGNVTAKVNAVYQAESSDRAFVSLHTLTGGDGRYAGASGYIRVFGSAASERADYVAVIRLAE